MMDEYIDCGKFHHDDCIGCGHELSKCNIKPNTILSIKMYERYGVERQKEWALENRNKLKVIGGK